MKKLFLLFSVTILLAAGCGKQSGTVENQPQPASLAVNSLSSATSSGNLQNAGPPIYSGRPIYVGILQISDNEAKGSLMLLAKPDERMGGGDLIKPTTLYIKTQRDYASLIGKKVLVGFTGDPNNHVNSFGLIDIEEDTGQSSFPK